MVIRESSKKVIIRISGRISEAIDKVKKEEDRRKKVEALKRAAGAAG